MSVWAAAIGHSLATATGKVRSTSRSTPVQAAPKLHDLARTALQVGALSRSDVVGTATVKQARTDASFKVWTTGRRVLVLAAAVRIVVAGAAVVPRPTSSGNPIGATAVWCRVAAATSPIRSLRLRFVVRTAAKFGVEATALAIGAEDKGSVVCAAAIQRFTAVVATLEADA